MKVFGDVTAGFSLPLANASKQFRLWRLSKKVASSQGAFKKIHRDGYGYYLNAKGFNARLVSEFLMDTLHDVNTNPGRYENMVPDERSLVAEAALILALCPKRCSPLCYV